jgi:hypothetical protein
MQINGLFLAFLEGRRRPVGFEEQKLEGLGVYIPGCSDTGTLNLMATEV